MKNIILPILLLGIINPVFGIIKPVFGEDKEKLVAKCVYDPGLDTEDYIIAPGDIFVYILNINGIFFTVNGIAHQSDDLRNKKQPLRGDLPLVEIVFKNNARPYWNLPYFTRGRVGASISKYSEESLTSPVPLRPVSDDELFFTIVESWRLTKAGDKFIIFTATALHPLTHSVYPECSLWKWWEE